MSRQNIILKLSILKRFKSQADFAEKLGVRDELVSRVICGRRSISTEEIKRWSDVLEVDVGLLITDHKKQIRRG